MLIINNRNRIDHAPDVSNSFSERLSRELVKVARANEGKEVGYGNEKILYDMYTKAISQLLEKSKDSLLLQKNSMNVHHK